jgi:Cys-tRNA(Pro)/Cys-tRNA(Cys) deacylase
MSRSTPATLALTRAGVDFTVAEYDYDPDAPSIGMQAAEALGESPSRVLKTLMTEVDGEAVCVVLASDREVSMKKLAAAVGGKSAKMMKPADAERVTGYKVGGVSAFGQRKAHPTVIDAAAMDEGLVYMNGGRRGLQVRLKPTDARDSLGATVAAISAAD